jgi:hypothetical protein
MFEAKSMVRGFVGKNHASDIEAVQRGAGHEANNSFFLGGM